MVLESLTAVAARAAGSSTRRGRLQRAARLYLGGPPPPTAGDQAGPPPIRSPNRSALAPFVPWIVNAQIQRKEVGENRLVTVIKRADTKGAAGNVLEALKAAPQQMNPAIELWTRLQREVKLDDPGALVEWQPVIAQAIQDGEQEIAEVQVAMQYLAECAPVPATYIPLGF